MWKAAEILFSMLVQTSLVKHRSKNFSNTISNFSFVSRNKKKKKPIPRSRISRVSLVCSMGTGLIPRQICNRGEVTRGSPWTWLFAIVIPFPPSPPRFLPLATRGHDPFRLCPRGLDEPRVAVNIRSRSRDRGGRTSREEESLRMQKERDPLLQPRGQNPS